MRIRGLRRAVTSCAATALLGGCGASQPPISAPGVTQQTAAFGAHAGHSRSWMLPGSKQGDLVYISSYETSEVYVYKLPTLALVGTLTGFIRPEAECSDAAGNVWITGSEQERIFEYAHGGTSPIATLSDPGETPVSCSVDPKNGNLAVMNECPYPRCNSGHGNVAIYRHGAGSGTAYFDPAIAFYYFDGYDDKGDLFIDGRSKAGDFEFAELPKSSGTFTNITLNVSISFPGSVQWDGRHMTTSPQSISSMSPVIYRLQISGSAGTVIGTTQLQPSNCAFAQAWIQGKSVAATCGKIVDIWKYPTGGNPTKTGTLSEIPLGITISVAP